MNLGTAAGTARDETPGTAAGTAPTISALTRYGTKSGTGRNRQPGEGAVSLLSIEGTALPQPLGGRWWTW